MFLSQLSIQFHHKYTLKTQFPNKLMIREIIDLPITGPIDLNTEPLLFVRTFKFQAFLAKGLFFDTANP